MNGQVDDYGRALIAVSILSPSADTARQIDAWIDTGFNGDLVLPAKVIEEPQLQHPGTVKAILADGPEVALKTYACTIDWFDEQRHLEVVANSGEYPLLGVGLLLSRELRISYRTGEIKIQ